MIKVYLMCPYTDENPEVLEQRFDMANAAAMYLMKKGYLVFSPISHSHPIGGCIDKKLDHDFWMNQDRPFVEWADFGIVLALDGWRESKGVNMELDWFEELGKPVMKLYPPGTKPVSVNETPACADRFYGPTAEISGVRA